MNVYTTFNCAFAVVCIAVSSFFLRSTSRWLESLQVAAFVTALSYPWDFFAASMGAWTYHDPGPRLLGVPANDFVFIFFGTVLASAVLPDTVLGRNSKPDSEDRRNEGPGDEIHGTTRH